MKSLQKECNSIITVKSRQELDGDTDEIEVISEGNFYFQNGKYFIMYKEDESMGKSFSLVKVDGKTVTIKRKGAYNSDFVCTENKKYSFVYHMPYGDMAMEIDTKKVDVSLGENGGSVDLCYTLETGGNVQTNNVSITVRKK